MYRVLRALSPFFVLIGVIVILFFGAMILGYLFLLGAITALIFFIVRKIQACFSVVKPIKSPQEKKTGRIIDADDWNVL